MASLRVRRERPRDNLEELKHADFLHVIAKENNFSSWTDMKSAVELYGLDRAAQQQRLKIALYEGQNRIVDRLLRDTPDLARDHFALSCALYDIDSVRQKLSIEPSLATQTFGPRRPILHLTYSRWFKHQPDLKKDMLATAEALLAAGADVNDGFPVFPGSDHLLSALYGAIGHANNMFLGQ